MVRQSDADMRKLLPTLLLLLVPLASHSQSPVPSNPDEGRILTLENAWNQAQQQKDASALNMLLADELVYVEYDGSLMSKAEYLASVQSPSLHPAHVVNESMSVHLFGEVAVVNGVCRENGIKHGKPYSVRMRFTDVWARRGEKWVCVASQSTSLGQ